MSESVKDGKARTKTESMVKKKLQQPTTAQDRKSEMRIAVVIRGELRKKRKKRKSQSEEEKEKEKKERRKRAGEGKTVTVEQIQPTKAARICSMHKWRMIGKRLPLG